MRRCVHEYIYVCMYRYVYIFVYTYGSVYVCVHVYVNVHVHGTQTSDEQMTTHEKLRWWGHEVIETSIRTSSLAEHLLYHMKLYQDRADVWVTCTCTFARCRWADDNSSEIEVMRSWEDEKMRRWAGDNERWGAGVEHHFQEISWDLRPVVNGT